MQLQKLFLNRLDWESIRLCRHFCNNKKNVSELKTKTLLSLLNSALCLFIVIKTDIFTPSM